MKTSWQGRTIPGHNCRKNSKFSYECIRVSSIVKRGIACAGVRLIAMGAQTAIEIRQISPTTSEAIMGRHRVVMDRPPEKGGTDRGPMGGPLFLASVGGCFMSNLLAAIRARAAEVSDVRVEAIGTLDDGNPPRYTSVELLVSAECRDRELIEKLVTIAERSCIMVATLGAADIALRVRIAQPV
jgi:putative redox protein